MKKTLSLFVLAFAGLNIAYAQTEQGTKNLGLNLSYHSTNQKSFVTNYLDNLDNEIYSQKQTSSNYFIGPSFSYFIANKLEMGVSAIYGYDKYKVDYSNDPKIEQLYTDYEVKQNSYIGTFFLRKYVMFTEQLGLRTGPYISYSYSKTTSDTGNENSYKSYIGGIDLGIEYFPIKKLGIAANLADISYHHSKQDLSDSNETKSNTFGFSLTNSLNLSLVWVFSK